MAYIETRRLSDGSTGYRVVWTDPGGRRHRRQFSRAITPRPAEDARKFKVRIEAELLAGTYVDPSAGRLTFADYAVEWLAGQHHTRASTAAHTAQLLRVHLLPALGAMRLSAIRRRDIQAMVGELRTKAPSGSGHDQTATLSPSYVGAIYRLAATIFRAAVADRLIPESPCTRIRLPRVERAEIIIPTAEQVELAAQAIAPRHAALIVLAASTGLRSGELRALDTTRARVLERVVRVDRQLHTPDTGPHHYGPPKTDNGYREVPLTAHAAETLAAHLARFGTGVDGLIFTGRGGVPLRRKHLAARLGPILRGLGLPPRSGMHVFRHYFASGLIAAGLDLVAVAALLGDAREEVLRTYAHLWEDHEQRSRAAVEAAFGMGHQGAHRGLKGLTGGSPAGTGVTPLARPVTAVPQARA